MPDYMYNKTEVVLTGRRAKKSSRRGGRETVLYEVTPKDQSNGSWTEWVQLSELYEIEKFNVGEEF